MNPDQKSKKREKKIETQLYLTMAIIAFGLMCLGYYCMSLGNVIYVILGIFFFTSGLLLGIIFFGDRWNFF